MAAWPYAFRSRGCGLLTVCSGNHSAWSCVCGANWFAAVITLHQCAAVAATPAMAVDAPTLSGAQPWSNVMCVCPHVLKSGTNLRPRLQPRESPCPRVRRVPGMRGVLLSGYELPGISSCRTATPLSCRLAAFTSWISLTLSAIVHLVFPCAS